MSDKSKSEKIWNRIFGWLGVAMFIAATFKSFVTMFWLNKDVTKMGVFEIGFAVAGFVFAIANRELGHFANTIGKRVAKKA